MKQPLYEPRSGVLTVQYQPDADTVLIENPPRFTWIPARPENDRYVLQLSTAEEFNPGSTRTIQPIPYNLYTPDAALASGTYYWRYALLPEESETGDTQEPHSQWSRVRRFTVPQGLPETPLPDRQSRFARAPKSHPRLWLGADELDGFRKRIQEDGEGTGWNAFYAKSVLPWLDRPLIPEPARYPDNRRVAKLWRQMYIDCQEVLYAIRHLSVAGIVLKDPKLIERAKQWVLHVLEWDAEGTTSRDYNDEAAFRIAGALAWAYDWLHGELSGEERSRLKKVLLRRTEQVAYHVIDRSRIHQVPYDSHAVRSLSSVLAPCCMAFWGEEPEAEEWLHYTVEYFYGLYSPWGGADGGWAEGPMYWTTGMAYVTEAMNLLKKFAGLDLYQRPFFRKTGDFPLYCFSPDTIRASFCDQSVLGDKPGLKTAFNIRQFAGTTGNGLYQWYYEQVKAWDTHPESKFYNYGWWDFPFDEMVYRHDYPVIEAQAPVAVEPVKWFRDIGWVALHHRMHEPEQHMMLLTKSSRYGSISHSHGDQNSFVLHAYGEPLAIDSGYYVAFGSTMHENWRRQTKSKNTLLIDGKGQYAGKDKVLNMQAAGVIECAERRKDCSYVRADATLAYRENVPYLTRFIREIYFIRDSYFVIVDSVDLSQPGQVDWLFHTLHPMKLGRQSFTVAGAKAEMYGRFVYCSSGDLKLSQTDDFDGADPAEVEGLGKQWHLTAATGVSASHRIAALLAPAPKGEGKNISFFMDDQDHGIQLYFTEDGETYKVELAKAY